MTCHGRGEEHCCWREGQVCEFLRDDGPRARRRWVCTLRERLGSWEAVHADPAYRAAWGDFRCGDFGPAEHQCCYSEG